MAAEGGGSDGGGGQRPTSVEVHAGTRVQIRNNGDYIIDTTEADRGTVSVVLNNNARFNVIVGSELAFSVWREGGTIRIDLGEAADQRVVLGDALMQLLNDFWQSKYDFHTHPTAMGPSGPPLPLFTGTRMTDDQLSDIAKTKKR
jgi:hypothetical protein